MSGNQSSIKGNLTSYSDDNLQWHEMEIVRMPFLREGLTAHYEGSIDKAGGNADWDWWLYRDARGEWVLFETDGPGCIHNFVQHRYPSSETPVFRFYFDGEEEPRHFMTPADFGDKPPFIRPLADKFVGDDIPPRGRGPIWIVRSFVPLPFKKSCRITSSVRLEGHLKENGEGGWGHVIYHRYTGDQTFPDMPKSPNAKTFLCEAIISSGDEKVLFEHAGAASIVDWRLRLSPANVDDLWIRITWDDTAQPAVWSPIGAFFGNEFGNHPVGFLTHGQSADGTYYFRLPMPFWKSARIELCNKSKDTNVSLESQILLGQAYPEELCGYFRATEYYPVTEAVFGQDTVIGSAVGRGHIVAATLTARTVSNQYVSCEGDVRLHLDGNMTPQIESDGSESHACYGWGFVYPPQQNPFSGYDGSSHPLYEFSETRVHVGDIIPFQTGFRFCLEAGSCNDEPMRHSGVVLYYGRNEAGMTLTDTLDIGNKQSEDVHQYRAEKVIWRGELESRYEDGFSTPLADCGIAHTGFSEFTVAISPDNKGVRLRRRSDQLHGRQQARVFVDGIPVTERTWYHPDSNTHRRWLEDEFEIPSHYTVNKKGARIRIEHLDQAPGWTEFYYWIFSRTVTKKD